MDAKQFLEAGIDGQRRGFRTYPYLVGPPGCGKTDMIREFAEDNGFNLKIVILSRYGNIDVGGAFVPDVKSGQLKHYPTTRIIEGIDDEPTIISFDEVGNADPMTLTAMQAILQDREMEGTKIPDNVFFVLAGNLPEHGTGARKLPWALQDRLLQYKVEFDIDNWIDWGTQENLDMRIISFVGFAKSDAFPEFDARSSEGAQATPRSWANMSGLIEGRSEIDPHLVFSAIGESVGSKFLLFCNSANELMSFEDIARGVINSISRVDLQWLQVSSIVSGLAGSEGMAGDMLSNVYDFVGGFADEMLSIIVKAIEKYAEWVVGTDEHSRFIANVANRI